MAEMVRITDVSPRDGLQNEAGVIPTAEKVELIRLLRLTGVEEVEITSFVSPKWVPQLADAAAVIKGVCEVIVSNEGQDHFCESIALVPNAKGLDLLDKAEWAAWGDIDMEVFVPPVVGKIALFTAASETFSMRNTNGSIAETMERFKELLKVPRAQKKVRAYISCAIACPFEGPIRPGAVADVAAQLIEMDVTELDLGDTIGAGTPDTVLAMLAAVRDRIGPAWFDRAAVVLHLHDTFGRAAECVKAALDFGIRTFDGSVAGLGGCPYASTPGRRAPGNISTELLVRTVQAAGFQTNVDMQRLEEAAAYARKIVSASRESVGGGGS